MLGQGAGSCTATPLSRALGSGWRCLSTEKGLGCILSRGNLGCRVGEGPPRHLLTPPLLKTVREILSSCLALVLPRLGALGWQVVDAESRRCLDAHSAAFPSLQPMDSPRSASLLCLQPPGGPGAGRAAVCSSRGGRRGAQETSSLSPSRWRPGAGAAQRLSCPEVGLGCHPHVGHLWARSDSGHTGLQQGQHLQPVTAQGACGTPEARPSPAEDTCSPPGAWASVQGPCPGTATSSRVQRVCDTCQRPGWSSG